MTKHAVIPIDEESIEAGCSSVTSLEHLSAALIQDLGTARCRLADTLSAVKAAAATAAVLGRELAAARAVSTQSCDHEGALANLRGDQARASQMINAALLNVLGAEHLLAFKSDDEVLLSSRP
ncbi:hypothetical protein [Salinarimonas soli]|uniref:Uncharacterized protein n=1 Tax=Salinarimonas soli TaxID=1638099 RepID=A0A5B2VR42_9HYPH|nr:hypothetical protein [Salinarimonas soli]KAA2241138.1 hypothetical protein F0L46_04895 [Salinarimonas soli]